MKKLNELSLNARLLLLVISFFFIPFSITGLYWYKQSTSVIETNAARYSGQMIEQINDRLDDYFAELDRMTLPTVIHPKVSAFLKMDLTDPYELLITKRQLLDDVFFNLLSNRLDVINLSIVTEKGYAVSTYYDSNSLDVFQRFGKADLQADGSINRNLQIRGISWLIGGPVLTVTRGIIDPATLQQTGLLVLDLNYRKIANLLDKVKMGDTDRVWIANSEGYIMYHSEESRWGKKAALPEEIVSNHIGHFIDQSSNERKLITYAYSGFTHWFLVTEVPINELIVPIVALRNVTILFGVLLIGLALFIIGGFSLSLTRSLLTLQRLMIRAEKGDLTVVAPSHKNIQINSLYRTFNKMVSELRRLIEVVHLSQLKEKEMEIKQMESKLLIMQSQINPHFLYNVLEVINSYAIEAGVKPISSMAGSVAGMLRYNVGNPQKVVTLYEEFGHIVTYLDVQQERYSRLNVTLNVNQAMMKQVATVRLILHPIVENAFIHGYEAYALKPGDIDIEGTADKDQFILMISDSGRGFSPSVMAKYNTLFTETTISQIVREHHLLNEKSIGLWNVHCRLRLTFGEPYGLYIMRSNEQGTVIRIILPWSDRSV
ncbi:MAG: hypothetical protein K0R67_3826 [Paenibacillus sp.]|nr:hypothetical protein [Paenibacillus sp.]